MSRRFVVCMFALVAFSISVAQDVHGGHNGQSIVAGADGGDGSNGGDNDNSSDWVGYSGDTDPDKYGYFYLPDTRESCNPGPQDAGKVESFR